MTQSEIRLKAYNFLLLCIIFKQRGWQLSKCSCFFREWQYNEQQTQKTTKKQEEHKQEKHKKNEQQTVIAAYSNNIKHQEPFTLSVTDLVACPAGLSATQVYSPACFLCDWGMMRSDIMGEGKLTDTDVSASITPSLSQLMVGGGSDWATQVIWKIYPSNTSDSGVIGRIRGSSEIIDEWKLRNTSCTDNIYVLKFVFKAHLKSLSSFNILLNLLNRIISNAWGQLTLVRLLWFNSHSSVWRKLATVFSFSFLNNETRNVAHILASHPTILYPWD